jgi:hypothetical protein
VSEELRNAIGRVLYEASTPFMDDDERTWEELYDEAKEICMQRAEKVVEAYLHHIRSERGQYFDDNGDMIVPDSIE